MRFHYGWTNLSGLLAFVLFGACIADVVIDVSAGSIAFEKAKAANLVTQKLL